MFCSSYATTHLCNFPSVGEKARTIWVDSFKDNRLCMLNIYLNVLYVISYHCFNPSSIQKEIPLLRLVKDIARQDWL